MSELEARATQWLLRYDYRGELGREVTALVRDLVTRLAQLEAENDRVRADLAQVQQGVENSHLIVKAAGDRIRLWLVQTFRYTASTLELDEVLQREIAEAVRAALTEARAHLPQEPAER